MYYNTSTMVEFKLDKKSPVPFYRQIVDMVFAQAAICALLGAGLGLGLCAIAGRIFTMYGFPFRLMWFAPAAGGVAVVLVSVGAAALSMRPVVKMQPALFLAGR